MQEKVKMKKEGNVNKRKKKERDYSAL